MRRYVLTPEIPVIISCVSSPLPLAACLWCMLSTRDRHRLRNNVSGDARNRRVRAWRVVIVIVIVIMVIHVFDTGSVPCCRFPHFPATFTIHAIRR